MLTSAGQRADGKTVWFEVWEQKRDTPGKVKEHIQSGWCRHLYKSIVHINRKFREHREKNKTLHDGAGTSNDGIGIVTDIRTHKVLMSSTNIHFSALG